MLPAIVLILFFTGAVNAANMVLSQTEETKKTLALFLAIGLGILPAWQTAEVWSEALTDRRSSYSEPYKPNSPGLSEAGKGNSNLP